MVANEKFDLLDYFFFGGMLLVSALIGIYFAFFAKKKQNTVKEYLLGGKEMGVFPISMSLVASSISGIALIGVPAEMYTFGTQLWVIVIADLLSYTVMAVVFLPIMFKLQLTSSYEYFEKRFNSSLRRLSSALFLLGTMLYIPLVIYVPALAFAQVTGASITVLIPTVCAICIFYTTLGGLKAVAWTDTVQMMLILLGVVVLSVIGTIQVGGLGAVWERSLRGGRIELFNWDPDPTVRHTFWTLVIGDFFMGLSFHTIDQSIVQRYLAMPSLRKARMAVVVFCIGSVALIIFCCYTGLVLFAAFHECDPVTVKTVSNPDQLLPYFVLKYTGGIPALPGIFIAGVFSAALSTMSTCLNSMTGVLFEDFIRPRFRRPVSEAMGSLCMKGIVVAIGIASVLLASTVDKLGGIIQASSSLSGIASGPLLGVFLLGTLFPWSNSTGAMAGGIISTLFVGWISLGTQVAIARKEITYQMKPFSTEGCDNATLWRYRESAGNVSSAADVTSKPFPLYQVSYAYYSMIGTTTCVAIGLVVSALTGLNNPRKMNRNLLAPAIHRFISFDEDSGKGGEGEAERGEEGIPLRSDHVS